MKVLLIEPDYKNKYPPLGLMKLSTFHKSRRDQVVFFKGFSSKLQSEKWDRIYISTLFTFHWNKTIKTIKYYLKSVSDSKNIIVGGVMATLMKSEIERELTVTIIQGLLDTNGKIGLPDDESIDSLLPDYSIINPIENPLLNYNYPISDCYLTYATRGCIRKCSFCAVPIIEPIFSNSLSIADQVNKIRFNYGEKKDLILMDNNILASECFPKIINEIKELGFTKNAKLEYQKNGKLQIKNRYVDFNQGIDARLLTKDKLKLISEIAIHPLRIAFDNIKDKEIYIKKVRLAAEFNIKILSNYILYNYHNTPEDFYERLKINIDLNDEFELRRINTRIWSFPMKYLPVKGEEAKNRKYVDSNWNKKMLRGIQCILLATHGVVGPQKIFFERAFGKSVNEFKDILMLPEDFIISRNKYDFSNEMASLKSKMAELSKNERIETEQLILNNNFKDIKDITVNRQIQEILKIYQIRKELWDTKKK